MKAKTVYVVGGGYDIEQARKILELSKDVNIVCVNSVEDVPFKDRLSSDTSLIQAIHKFTAPPEFEDLSNLVSTTKGSRGYKRDYKYHK